MQSGWFRKKFRAFARSGELGALAQHEDANSHIVLASFRGLFALSVIFAATAYAEGKKGHARHQSDRHGRIDSEPTQRRGASFQFAIERDGVLELTGESTGASPLGAWHS